MKTFLALIVGLVLTAWATPARAYVVEITTSIELAGIADKDRISSATRSSRRSWTS